MASALAQVHIEFSAHTKAAFRAILRAGTRAGAPETARHLRDQSTHLHSCTHGRNQVPRSAYLGAPLCDNAVFRKLRTGPPAGLAAEVSVEGGLELIGESRSKEESVVCTAAAKLTVAFCRLGRASTILRRNLKFSGTTLTRRKQTFASLVGPLFSVCVRYIDPPKRFSLRGYKFLVLAPNAGARKQLFPCGQIGRTSTLHVIGPAVIKHTPAPKTRNSLSLSHT